MSAFATVQDLGSKWAHLTGVELDDVNQGLGEATLMIRQAFKNAGRDITSADPEILKLVCARMVRNAFPQDSSAVNIPAGVETTQVGVGPFQRSFKFSGGASRRLWIGPDEMKLLGLQAKKMFSLDMLPEGWTAP
ncbi:hypothetical protein [Timonella sp. A28]|uniref:hypothetical protein n=1 Tax=Timonella sp. A28 TaxID=3442640 RepID=UPI003EB8975B